MIDKELFRLIGKDKKYIFISVFLSILGLFANLAITYFICAAIGVLVAEKDPIKQVVDTNKYIYCAVGAITAGVLRYIIARLSGATREKLGRNVKKTLRGNIFEKILALGGKSAEDLNMAGFTQVSVEGVEQLDLYYSTYLPQFFYSLIEPLILFAVCFKFNYIFAIVMLVCVPIIPMSIVMVSKYAKKIFAKYWGIYTHMGDAFLDNMQGLKELKIYLADKRRHDEINSKSEEFRKITMKVLVMQLFSIFIMDLVAFTAAGVGSALAIAGAEGRLVEGSKLIADKNNIQMVVFLILVGVEFFLPLRTLGSAFHIAMNGMSAGKKIIKLLSLEVPKWGQEQVACKEIALSNLSFTYPEREKAAVKDINIAFKKGMSAIVGESGCGKSTLAGLIIGTLRSSEGTVTVDGKAIEDVSQQSYYAQLSVVSHGTHIFNDTVRNNFYLAKPDATDEEMMNALKSVNLDDFIAEEGLDKKIDEGGTNISGGQKQRLALAVNMVADKKIYIFDEATSNIDVESEAIIMNNIVNMSKEKTVILISHRLQNVVKADMIYYMKEGEVVEHGTHTQLMKEKKGYAEMYTEQKNLEEGYLKECEA